MRAGRLMRDLALDMGTVARDKGDVIREAIAQCGDDPASAETRAMLEQMLVTHEEETKGES